MMTRSVVLWLMVVARAGAGASDLPVPLTGPAGEQTKGARARLRDDRVAALEQLIEKTESGDERESAWARWALLRISPQADWAVPTLVAALEKRVPHVRLSCWGALTLIGPRASHAADRLREMAAAESPTLKGAAALTLVRIDPKNKPWATSLIRRGLKANPRGVAAVYLAEFLWRIEPQATRPLSVLGDCMEDREPFVRKAAATALGRLIPSTVDAVAPLIRGLDDADDGVRQQAADSLTELGKMSVEPLTEALNHESSRVRSYACRVLARIGAHAHGAFRPITQALHDESARVRRAAADALGRIGAEPDSPLGALTAALEDESELVRFEAARSLSRLRVESDAAIALLTEALASGDRSRRQLATYALAQLGPRAEPAAGILVKTLGDKDEKVQEGAAFALARIGARAVPPLVEALGAGDPQVRLAACNALEQIGPEAGHAAPALVSTLEKDTDVSVRIAAALALLHLRPEPKQAVAALLGALRDDLNQKVRVWAVFALGEIGPEPEKVLPQLLSMAEDESLDADVRRDAVLALSVLAPHSDATVPALIGLLHEEDEDCRRRAISALGVCGAAAHAAIGPLAALATDDSPHLSNPAVEALGAIEGPDAVPPLVQALESDDPINRANAALWLGRIGPEANTAVPALRAGLDDPFIAARCNAAVALWQIDGQTELAVSTLIDALQWWDPRAESHLDWVPAAPAFALGRMGPDAAPAVPALRELMTRAPEMDRFCIAEAMWSIEGDGATLLRTLTQLLWQSESWDPAIRYDRQCRIAHGLAEIGPEAKAAVPALILAMESEDASVRRVAGSALDRIETGRPARTSKHVSHPRVNLLIEWTR